jgi:hypothetical protein
VLSIADTISTCGVLLVGLAVCYRWVIWLVPYLKCQVTASGLTVGSFVAVQTVLGLALARCGCWSPSTLLVVWGVICAITLLCLRGNRTSNQYRLTKTAIGLGAIALIYCVLWFTYPHVDLMGERDGGVYLATAAELARTGDLGWSDPLSTAYGIQRTYGLFEYLGLVYQHYPRFLVYPGFYLKEPEMRVVPQFLGGYEPWLALALRAFGEPAFFRTNALLMAIGLFVFGCAGTRLLGSRGGATAMVLCGGILAIHWHARSAGNECLTFLLTWTCILAYRQVLLYPNHRFTGWLLLVPALALGQLKLAGWFLLPVLALDAGFRAGRHPQLRSALMRAVVALFLAGAMASVHGAVYCSEYLFGTYIHGFNMHGLRYESLVVGLPLLVIASALAGWATSKILWGGYRLGKSSRPRRIWMWSLCVVMVCVGRLALSVQRRHLEEIDNIWSNAANLAELANYLPTGQSLLGLAGLLWLGLVVHGRSRTLVIGLLALSFYFILNRNLDSLHPWASRRWVPVVFPACCLGLSYVIVQAVRDLKRIPLTVCRRYWQPLLLPLAVLISASLIQRPGWALVRSQPGRELVESHHRLQHLLGPTSVVVSIPSANIRRWLPWQLGRYGTISYALRADTIAWSSMAPVFQDLQKKGYRVIYLTDYPPQPWTIDHGFLQLVGSEELSWYAQQEEVRTLPVWPATRYITRLFAYEVTTTGSHTRGWFPESKEPPVHGTHLSGPFPWSLALSENQRFSSDNWKKPDPQTTSQVVVGSAWSEKRSRINVGELLANPLLEHQTSHSLIGWRIDVGMTSGRDPQSRVVANVVRQDNGDLKPKIMASESIGPDWTTFTLLWSAHRLTEESVLEIRSQRPPVGTIHPGGRVGVLVAPVIVRPILGTASYREDPLTTPSGVRGNHP